MKHYATVIAVLLLAAGALALRLPQLALRPMHNDEAVNALKYKKLHEEGRFEYDPKEYHGPTLYYLTAPMVWLSGAESFAESTERPYRMLPLVFSIGLILLTLALRREIGSMGVIFAALYAAASGAMTFYSRYYIHEMLLVFFSFAAIVCGWRFAKTRSLWWAGAAGACAGLMWATKETWIIPLAAAVGAVVLTMLWRRVRPVIPDPPPLPPLSVETETQQPEQRRSALWKGLAVLAVVCLLVAAAFFTSFFSHPRGFVDAVAAYKGYVSRGAGENTDHVWPFGWYLRLIAWYRADALPGSKVNRNPVFSEGAIVAFALIGIGFALVRRRTSGGSIPFARFLAFYTIGLTLAYSILRYKTPWCALGFLHAMILMAGFGIAQLIRVTPTVPGKVLVGLLMTIPAANLVRQSKMLNDRLYADVRNPWVYGHTSGDIETLERRMREVAKVHPLHEDVHVQVVTWDCWPIPWTLRGFDKVGYWPSPEAPAARGQKLDADVIIGPIEAWEHLPTGPEGVPEYRASSFGLRPGYVLWIYIKVPLWEELQKYWAAKSAR